MRWALIYLKIYFTSINLAIELYLIKKIVNALQLSGSMVWKCQLQTTASGSTAFKDFFE